MSNEDENNKSMQESNDQFRFIPFSSLYFEPPKPLSSIGFCEGADSDKNELKTILFSLQEKINLYDDEILKQYTSFTDNKKKRFVSLSLDKYYFLSNNISITDLPITHFNYFGLIQKNYQSYIFYYQILIDVFDKGYRIHNLKKASVLIKDNLF